MFADEGAVVVASTYSQGRRHVRLRLPPRPGRPARDARRLLQRLLHEPATCRRASRCSTQYVERVRGRRLPHPLGQVVQLVLGRAAADPARGRAADRACPGAFIESDLVDPRYFSAGEHEEPARELLPDARGAARRGGSARVRCVVGIDLGSTTTKAVVLDERRRGPRPRHHELPLELRPRGRGRADGGVRAARGSGCSSARSSAPAGRGTLERLLRAFRLEQMLVQLASLRGADRRGDRPERRAEPALGAPPRRSSRDLPRGSGPRRSARFADPDPPARSDFFRDAAGSAYARLAEERRGAGPASRSTCSSASTTSASSASRTSRSSSAFASTSARRSRGSGDAPGVRAAVEAAVGRRPRRRRHRRHGLRPRAPAVSRRSRSAPRSSATGSARTCSFPGTRTVLDIGGQDTKAIQVDAARHRDELPDERPLRRRVRPVPRLHRRRDEHGPARARAARAREPPRPCKINSTCTVFAGAELRERLSLGEKREDILAGLHRAVILRAMSLLARSGGIDDEFTFTGGVAQEPGGGAGARRARRRELRRADASTSRPTASTRARSARRSSPRRAAA